MNCGVALRLRLMDSSSTICPTAYHRADLRRCEKTTLALVDFAQPPCPPATPHRKAGGLGQKGGLGNRDTYVSVIFHCVCHFHLLVWGWTLAVGEERWDVTRGERVVLYARWVEADQHGTSTTEQVI